MNYGPALKAHPVLYNSDIFWIFENQVYRGRMLLNSSLQPWFNYESAASELNPETSANQLLAAVPGDLGCSTGGPNGNCSDICSNVTQFFDPYHPENFISCMSWARTCTNALGWSIIPGYTGWNSSWDILLPPFEAVGLSPTEDSTCGAAIEALTADVGGCLEDLYGATRWATDDSSIPGSCRHNEMFDWFAGGSTQDCFQDLCSPSTLDPDIGGIGVRYNTV